MADFQYTRDPQRMFFLGMDLNRPVDELKPMKAAVLENLRQHQFGRISPRFGMTKLVDVSTCVHSIRRLNDLITGDYSYIIGDETTLYVVRMVGGVLTATLVDTSYSGNPLALLPYRPEQSPASWMFVGDSSRMRKVNQPGTVHQIGLPSPTVYPDAVLAPNTGYSSFYKVINEGNDATGWSADGSVITSAVLNTTQRININTGFIAGILYDSGVSGWATIHYADNTNPIQIGEGCHLVIGQSPSGSPSASASASPSAGTSPSSSASASPSGSPSASPSVSKSASPSSSVSPSPSSSPSASVSPSPSASTSASTSASASASTSGSPSGSPSPSPSPTPSASPSQPPSEEPEGVMVQSVSVASTPTTISKIDYDSGSTGPCAMVLETSFSGCELDTMLYNQGKDAYCRVLAVMEGPLGRYSLRTSTAIEWQADDTVYAVPSLRCYCNNTHAAGDPIYAGGIKGTFSGAEGTGYLEIDFSSSPLDLSRILDGVPTDVNDYLHISIAVSDPSLVQEGKIMFDVANSPTFEGDYYYKGFRVSDLSPNLSVTAPVPLTTVTQTTVQREIIDQYSNPDYYGGGIFGSDTTLEPRIETIKTLVRGYSGVLAPTHGGDGWTELRFSISDLTKVGENVAHDLRQVYRVRISLTVATGSLYTILHSVSMSGGHGPDVNVGDDYIYRYRARCSSTGAVSNWGPAYRGGVYARRQQINVTAPSQYTDAAEADVLDFQRYGGQNLQWNYVGTVKNSNPPSSLEDSMPDDVAAGLDSTLLTNYQPWPYVGVPFTGETESVCGTSIRVNGTGYKWNTRWAPGTIIEINNLAYTIYRVVSETLLELNENAGVMDDVSFRITRPTIVSQPFPCLWGPVNETLFACGDPVNPQRLYFTNATQETTRDDNWVDITSPSEPLQNGVVFNGRSYVFSSERMFQLTQAMGANELPTWQYTEIPNGRGLYARWALTGIQSTPGPAIFFLGKDGIYATDGGTPVSLTGEDLRPLFPYEGNPGEAVNGVLQPDMSLGKEPYLRLAYYDNYLYFDYPPVVES